MQCVNVMNSTITSPVFMEFWHLDPNNNTLDFSDYPCFAYKCCLNVTYSVTIDTGTPPTPYPLSIFSINKIGLD